MPLDIHEEVLEEFMVVHMKQGQPIKQVLKTNKKLECLTSPKTIPQEQ
jgi:hypothetical protein